MNKNDKEWFLALCDTLETIADINKNTSSEIWLKNFIKLIKERCK